MLLSEFDCSLLGRGDAHHLMAGAAHDVSHVERDHGLVLDHQDADRGDALQLATRLLEAALGSLDIDAEDTRGIIHGEAFEHREQQHLSLQRRHVGQRFFQPPAHAVAAVTLFEVAERLAQPVEQREDAELGVLGLGNQIRLLQDDLGTKPDPLVAAFLRAGDGPGIATQKGQRPGDRLGNLVGWSS